MFWRSRIDHVVRTMKNNMNTSTILEYLRNIERNHEKNLYCKLCILVMQFHINHSGSRSFPGGNGYGVEVGGGQV